MFFADPRTHAVPLFLETKQLSIFKYRYCCFEQMSLLMCDVYNNLAPDNIKNMSTNLSSVHSYPTRSVTNENYYVEQVRTENMKQAFSISGALIWNSIPLSVKTLKKVQFKVSSRVKRHHFSKFVIFRRLNKAHQELSFKKKNPGKNVFFCAD